MRTDALIGAAAWPGRSNRGGGCVNHSCMVASSGWRHACVCLPHRALLLPQATTLGERHGGRMGRRAQAAVSVDRGEGVPPLPLQAGVDGHTAPCLSQGVPAPHMQAHHLTWCASMGQRAGGSQQMCQCPTQCPMLPTCNGALCLCPNAQLHHRRQRRLRRPGMHCPAPWSKM